MGNIIACCPWPRKQHYGKVVKLTGSWVLNGIEDFIQYCAESLHKDAENHLAEGKRRFESERVNDTRLLLDEIDRALQDNKDDDQREHLQVARDHVENAIRLTNQALRLEKTMDFPIERWAHGFLVRQKDGVGEVVKWISDPGLRALPREQLPVDIAMYQRHELSVLESWAFCTQKTAQAWKEKSADERKRQNAESWLPYNHGKPENAGEGDHDLSSGEESLDTFLLKRNLVPVNSRMHDLADPKAARSTIVDISGAKNQTKESKAPKS